MHLDETFYSFLTENYVNFQLRHITACKYAQVR